MRGKGACTRLELRDVALEDRDQLLLVLLEDRPRR